MEYFVEEMLIFNKDTFFFSIGKMFNALQQHEVKMELIFTSNIPVPSLNSINYFFLTH